MERKVVKGKLSRGKSGGKSPVKAAGPPSGEQLTLELTINGDKGSFEGLGKAGAPIQGKFTWTSGDQKGNVYEGSFAHDTCDGLGTYTFPGGQKHIGTFKDGKPEGFGTCTWPEGRKYTGDYKDGKRHGLGTQFNADLSVEYSGLWTNGEPDKSAAGSPSLGRGPAVAAPALRGLAVWVHEGGGYALWPCANHGCWVLSRFARECVALAVAFPPQPSAKGSGGTGVTAGAAAAVTGASAALGAFPAPDLEWLSVEGFGGGRAWGADLSVVAGLVPLAVAQAVSGAARPTDKEEEEAAAAAAGSEEEEGKEEDDAAFGAPFSAVSFAGGSTHLRVAEGGAVVERSPGAPAGGAPAVAAALQVPSGEATPKGRQQWRRWAVAATGTAESQVRAFSLVAKHARAYTPCVVMCTSRRRGLR
jgi:hypothetical protein